MSAAAMGAQAAGSVMKGIGDIYSGNAQGAAADYNAQMARNNEGLAIAQSEEEARRAGISAQKQIGQGSANAGASGVARGGSVLDVLSNSMANAELNIQTIRHQGYVKAAGFANQSYLDSMQAQTARTSGYLGASADLLQAGGNMAAGRNGFAYGGQYSGYGNTGGIV